MTRRLYCPQINTGTTTIIGPEAHHGRDVLRLQTGENIGIFDGKGGYASATVTRISKSQIDLQVPEILTASVPDLRITLATAVPKFAHQETLVRMCTEIGVAVFYPVICERSSVREQFRVEKWHRWTVEACKQSGNNFLPEIKEIVHFSDLIRTAGEFDLVVYGDTQTGLNSDGTKGQKVNNVLILVGPEGGFTPGEFQLLADSGAVPYRIGQNILRIETAAVALCTLFAVCR
jgi:16S rRNA (uracil1498-N3)-methyltransferase